MGQNYSSGQTAVNGTVTTVGTFTPSKNTVVGAVGFKGGAGSTTIGTVPANRLWRIIAVTVSATGSATSLSTLDLNGVGVVSATCGAGGNNASHSLSFTDAYILTAGQVARVTTDAVGSASGSIAYIEEVV